MNSNRNREQQAQRECYKSEYDSAYQPNPMQDVKDPFLAPKLVLYALSIKKLTFLVSAIRIIRSVFLGFRTVLVVELAHH